MSNLEQLILDMKESLEREIRDGFTQVATRLDTQAARLERHAANWQTGRRWSARMDDWAEKIDEAMENKDRQIAELHRRIEELERRIPPAA
jgi:hypothetical protein